MKIRFMEIRSLLSLAKSLSEKSVATATLAAILSLSPRSPSASKFSPKIIFRIGSKVNAIIIALFSLHRLIG
ncbi:MAG: hypothetical protein HUU50_07850 [Candidatus Brocadiae bacterium]|nr:hypothetical protein [Candidatus Brocadiia bacterium]